MRWANHPKIDNLQTNYDAAVTVEKICAIALRMPRLRGEVPSQAAKRAAARAQEELTRARDQLLTAITEAITTGRAATPWSGSRQP